MKITAKRTNEKPTGYREVDLPEYEVFADGQLIGTVHAYLTREANHYTAGSVKRWAYRGTSFRVRGNGYTSKAYAQAALAATEEV